MKKLLFTLSLLLFPAMTYANGVFNDDFLKGFPKYSSMLILKADYTPLFNDLVEKYQKHTEEAVVKSQNFIWPTNSCGELIQGYSTNHKAVAIACERKGPIFAVADATVTTAKYDDPRYGNYIILNHGQGIQTLYGGNEVLYVVEGDDVSQGQTMAWMGNTNAMNDLKVPHLYWEVIHNHARRNPLNYL